MAEKKCIIMQLRPQFEELGDAPTYTEVQVKEVLFAFARDLGCKWHADKLRRYINLAFDYQLQSTQKSQSKNEKFNLSDYQ